MHAHCYADRCNAYALLTEPHNQRELYNMSDRSIDTVQGLIVLLVVPLGVIPLAQRLFGAEQGFVFRGIFGDLADPYAWVVPLAVMSLAVLVVALLEHRKGRST